MDKKLYEGNVKLVLVRGQAKIRIEDSVGNISDRRIHNYDLLKGIFIITDLTNNEHVYNICQFAIDKAYLLYEIKINVDEIINDNYVVHKYISVIDRDIYDDLYDHMYNYINQNTNFYKAIKNKK